MKPTVWVVDDDSSIRWVLEKALSEAGMQVRTFESAAPVLQALDGERPDLVISDVRMPGEDGFALLRRIQADHHNLPVLLTTAYSDMDAAVAAFEEGAFEYLPKPFDVAEAVSLARHAIAQAPAAEEEPAAEKRPEILGEAPAMQQVFRIIGRLVSSEANVLITGESGTGKELVARALHRHSPRSDGPFVALNTAAVPAELLESELFGHERGAFTGAVERRVGRFEEASGGTLFLDEIGDMPAELQTRLLRVLAEGEFQRVGGRQLLHADVRIIAATHQDLSALIRDGGFREDLYHRLNVVPIHLPPLRDRREDIPQLVRHFLEEVANELGLQPKQLSAETLEVLQGHGWPGNVRELENLCRRLTLMAPGTTIFPEDLPPPYRDSTPEESSGDWQSALAQWVRAALQNGQSEVGDRVQADTERVLIREALAHTGGHRQRAAALLGWGRNTLTRKIKELQMEEG
ncbi:nitrogen regulation protein NR(I) [Thiohalorhabdus methylotrophus]|uniref:DNA-binding transcriptional regulator NtrC n=1 Tax=Thiohalorhabdus methylotrophus TaxID=3242694 RepID=A0ABV4TX12_9GAMM